jgi:hypothetical protein
MRKRLPIYEIEREAEGPDKTVNRLLFLATAVEPDWLLQRKHPKHEWRWS